MKNLYLTLAILALLAATACGKPGPAGATGATGQSIIGPTGPQGQPGTQVNLVQFCQGITPSYPSTFAEVGVCIGGSLYAVYSENSGFLTLIPPGTYTSNGVNASCTFTVLPNCVVE